MLHAKLMTEKHKAKEMDLTDTLMNHIIVD